MFSNDGTKKKKERSSLLPYPIQALIGSTFADTDELARNEYHFPRKQIKITHHVLDALLQGGNALISTA